eukprot:scaffold1893_cov220-Amphora_coffeaeformis.AAC.8
MSRKKRRRKEILAKQVPKKAGERLSGRVVRCDDFPPTCWLFFDEFLLLCYKMRFKYMFTQYERKDWETH